MKTSLRMENGKGEGEKDLRVKWRVFERVFDRLSLSLVSQSVWRSREQRRGTASRRGGRKKKHRFKKPNTNRSHLYNRFPWGAPQKALKVFVFNVSSNSNSDTSNSFPVFFPSMFFELLRESFRIWGIPLPGLQRGRLLRYLPAWRHPCIRFHWAIGLIFWSPEFRIWKINWS